MSQDFTVYGSWRKDGDSQRRCNMRWENDTASDVTITSDEVYTYVSKTFQVTKLSEGSTSGANSSRKSEPSLIFSFLGTKNQSITTKKTDYTATISQKFDRPLDAATTKTISGKVRYRSNTPTYDYMGETTKFDYSFTQEPRTKKELVIDLSHPLGDTVSIKINATGFDPDNEYFGNRLASIYIDNETIYNSFNVTCSSSGYIFTGLYRGSGGIDKVEFPYNIGSTYQTKLYAGWEKVGESKIYGVTEDKALVDITTASKQVLLEKTYTGISQKTCEEFYISKTELIAAGAVDPDEFIVSAVSQYIHYDTVFVNGWRPLASLTGSGCANVDTDMNYPNAWLSDSYLTVRICNCTAYDNVDVTVRILLQRIKIND